MSLIELHPRGSMQAYDPSKYIKDYENYYKSLQYGGNLPYFSVQSGAGLGNIIGGLAKTFIPIAKNVGKAVLRKGVQTGLNLAADMTSGMPLKQALSRTVRSVLKKNNRKKPVTNRRGTKRKAPARRNKGKRNSKRARDIFN